MKISIKDITIKPGRRTAQPEKVRELADSIAVVGLLNPITLDREDKLIAGLHRLEAAKLLGWSEIEYTISSAEGLTAELAEIDENVIRSGLSALDYNDLILRRKEIFEALNPDRRNGGDRRSESFSLSKSQTEKSFAEDTAEKLNVSPRTVYRQIQTAKNLLPETKQILRDGGVEVSKKDAMTISQLPAVQQKEAASLLASGAIRSVKDYRPPARKKAVRSSGRQTDIAANIARLKDTTKECRCTPEIFLSTFAEYVRRSRQEIEVFTIPFYEAVFPSLSPEDVTALRQQIDLIHAAADQFFNDVTSRIDRKQE